MQRIIFIISLLFYAQLLTLYAQKTKMLPDLDQIDMLLGNMTLQIEITSGIDDMYNFEFERAESQFQWLKKYYASHPLPYFLMALSQWWKIMPNTANTQYDKNFNSYLDSTIYFAQQLFKKKEEDIEATFFLSAAYGFKGRLQGERKEWLKAVFSGKKALKYLDYSKNKENLSIEFLFGHALYNYYAVWIRENYRFLRPFLWFFDKGDKTLGIEQLERVVHEAFYTRIEGQVYLMRMYDGAGMRVKALNIATQLHEKYPNNPYFHRYYARILYLLGKSRQLEKVSLNIIDNIEKGVKGYEETSGRYAGFFLGNLYRDFGKKEKAIYFFKKAVEYTEKIKVFDSGYYLLSLYYLGEYAEKDEKLQETKYYYDKLLKHGNKKQRYYKNAKTFIKKNKKALQRLEE